MATGPLKQARERFRGSVPSTLRAPVAAFFSRTPFLRGLLANGKDLDVLYAERPFLRAGPWLGVRSGRPTTGTTERVIEIAWVLSRYSGESRVLDIGSSFALPFYLDELRAFGIPELHGVDLAPRAISGMRMTRADVRAMPFADGYFDLVLCVSTIEHIGFVNDIYGVDAPKESHGDIAALREIRRVLAPSGRVLVTVPFGAAQDHGWFKQYDDAGWRALVHGAGMREIETECFAYRADGWRRVDAADLAATRYGDNGAPSAASVRCAVLRL
jgi:SAM-dependent methyltransferase